MKGILILFWKITDVKIYDKEKLLAFVTLQPDQIFEKQGYAN